METDLVGNTDAKTLRGILDLLPLEVTYADSDDRFVYFNEREERVFERREISLGKDVFELHPDRCLPEVRKIISEMRSGERDTAEYWIEKEGRFIHIRYFALREDGEYRGVVEVVQDATRIRSLTGEKKEP